MRAIAWTSAASCDIGHGNRGRLPAANCTAHFVRELRELFVAGGMPSRYGCLRANSIVEFAGRDGAPVDVRAAEYWDRLNGAFSNGLRCAASRERDDLTPSEDRAGLLAAATFAGWLTVRVDAPRAQAVCDRMLIEMSSWWQPPDAPA